jgi:hypothetical protein
MGRDDEQAPAVDGIPEKARQLLETVEPKPQDLYEALVDYADGIGIDDPAVTAALEADWRQREPTPENFDELHRFLRDAGHAGAVRWQFGDGYAETWRETQRQAREWEREYLARGFDDGHGRPPLLPAKPGVRTRQQRLRDVSRPRRAPSRPRQLTAGGQ